MLPELYSVIGATSAEATNAASGWLSVCRLLNCPESLSMMLLLLDRVVKWHILCDNVTFFHIATIHDLSKSNQVFESWRIGQGDVLRKGHGI